MIKKIDFFISKRYLFPKTKDSFFSVITIFSFLGISLGVATLIIVMSVMNGFRDELTSKVLGMNGHLKLQLFNGERFSNYDDLKKKIESVDPGKDKFLVSPTISSQGLLIFRNFSTGILIKGIDDKSLVNREILSQKIDRDSLQSFKNKIGIIVGSKMKDKFNLKKNDVVKIISPEMVNTPFGQLTRSKNFRIIGFFETGMYEYDVSMILMPLETIQNFLDTGKKIDNLEIFASNFEDVNNIKNLIISKVSSYYRIYDWRKMNPSLFNAIEVERNVMFLILLLIVLVAAFNLISSMVMLVNNKKRDIGILRTLGVTKFQILKIFILSGFMIGFIGTTLGLCLGILFCININEIKAFIEIFTDSSLFSEEIYFFSKLPMIIDYYEVLGITIIALFLSFFATIYPAIKASNVEPISLIKWE